MTENDAETWTELPITQQIQLLQMNVHRIGIVNTLKKAFKGELETEDLLGP